MSESRVQACARVQITVEFAVADSVWGEGATIEQVNSQARDAAINIIRRGLVIEGLTVNSASKTHATLVGEPRVTAILVERQ
jgi:hypothetical protein